jgi:signal transduction histidine kinase
MQKSLTILKRGLLLVSIPLLAQAFFVGMLIRAQAENAAAQRWAVHTKNVIAKSEETYRRLLESYAAMRNRIVGADTSGALLSVHAADPVKEEVAELSQLVADNPEQQARVDAFGRRADSFLEILGRQRALIEQGREREAFDELDSGGRILGEMRGGVDEILGKEGLLDQERMSRLARLNHRQFWFALTGGFALVGATLALALVFFHGVIKRLSVLSDNTRRLAAGVELNPVLQGTDEVAQVDRAFHEMARSLSEKQADNEMFVYSVSHDLRSPLINLQGFSGELQLSCREMRSLFEHAGVPDAVRQRGGSLLSESFDESIHYIHAAVGRMSRIIDSLLRLSRAGSIQYQWQMVDLAELIGKVVDALHDAISTKGAEISVGELPPAWGDPTALEQVFANLIGNAAQYLDPARAGKIEVLARPPLASENLGGFQIYAVKDNGMGIPAAYHDRLFTPFYRLAPDVAQGEGIGLALVRRIVERHGGSIWMDSVAGVGSTFFVALPCEAPPGGPPNAGGRVFPQEQSPGAHSRWEPNHS